MTTEEKAKAYNDALRRAKELHEAGNVLTKTQMEIIFPQLKESEDERIRKAILGLTYIDGIEPILTRCSITAQDIRAYLEKQKEASKAIEAVERIDKYIDEHLANAHDMKDSNPGKKYYRGWDDALGEMAGILQDVYSGERQKEHFRDDTKMVEQKPAEHKAFEEWAEDYWSHNKVNNPYSYNKGDEIQFDHKGFVSFCEAYCYPQNLVLHDTFGYEEGRQTGRNEGVKLVLNNPEKYGLQKEQNSNIELIQKSWYMEGYHDREFNNEPRWVIKTGEGGPRYEENPKYGQIIKEKPKFYPGDVIKCTSIGSLWVRCKGGDNIRSDGHTACIGGGFELASEEETMQFFHELTENGYQWDCIKGRPIKKEQKPAEKQDYSGLNDFERAIHRGFLCAGVVNVPVNIIKETAQDCLAHLPVEWSEDFDKEVENIHKRYPEVSYAKLTRIAYHFSKWANRYKGIKWSEEEKQILHSFEVICQRLIENPHGEKFEVESSYAKKMLSWLKSLRPQSHWKPSDEQMEALNALNCHGDLSYVGQQNQLISLYNDLKKLM